MATIYPFLSFRLPLVEYTRRWLTVDGDDTQKRGGNHDFSGDKAVMPDKFDSSMHGTRNGEEMGVGKEAVALDVALPRAGLDPAKPFYIVLHGLNGGSAEVGWWVSWLFDWLVDWLVDWLAVCSIGWVSEWIGDLVVGSVVKSFASLFRWSSYFPGAKSVCSSAWFF